LLYILAKKKGNFEYWIVDSSK